MRHPFDLNPIELEAIDLDFAEALADDEAAQVAGGDFVTTLALGEEGGFCFPYPKPPVHRPPYPKPRPTPTPIDPPVYTTLALGEEGGDVTTLALGEEGGTW